jgi:FAD/FMN-containing dehydrogenase
MLAVATEITVKLTPKPQLAQCVLAAFDDVVKAGDAVAAIIAAGIIPAGLEMMDQPATAAVEEFVHAGYPLDAKAILLCESDGTPEEVADEIARMRAVLEPAVQPRCVSRGTKPSECVSGPGARLRFRRPAALAGLLLHGRHDSAQARGRDARGDPEHGAQVRAALHQRLSCG